MRTPMMLAVVTIAGAICTQAAAHDLMGPARFCGYSPIIDLLPGESITALESGVHGGKFRWEGLFGSLDVSGIGWARRPRGRIAEAWTSTNPARFAQRRVDGRYVVAIWNGAQGAAYFSSVSPFTPDHLRAISRVDLFQEGQSPEGCDLRTVFSFD